MTTPGCVACLPPDISPVADMKGQLYRVRVVCQFQLLGEGRAEVEGLAGRGTRLARQNEFPYSHLVDFIHSWIESKSTYFKSSWFYKDFKLKYVPALISSTQQKGMEDVSPSKDFRAKIRHAVEMAFSPPDWSDPRRTVSSLCSRNLTLTSTLKGQSYQQKKYVHFRKQVHLGKNTLPQ